MEAIRIACLLVGYLLGLFQTAFVYGKARGIDIREHGSGNSGTTNALRVLGTKAGLLVFAGDCLKCMAAVWLVRLTFGRAYPEIRYLLCLYAATGAILGHNFPFYMSFKGGKGIAATAGLLLSFHPYFVAVGAVLFFGSFLTTHYVSVGSLLLYIGFLIQTLYLGQTGFFGLPPKTLYELYGLALFLTGMALWRHRENIGRLFKGTERKTYLFRKKE
ncbi:MAG: glycerol-3-phosphate 1-O-acyltransferase PlsY [Clostridium sp.]|nr:glycerol-3-phosphate 1-O-acyltransferase PlsY [Clostridium sp.]